MTLPKPKPNLIFKALADGGLIFSPDLEVYFSVNAVGAKVWESLPPTCATLDEMVARLAAAYADVDAAVIRTDVEEMLAELSAHGLVEGGA